jgi:uncharacterized membrane protein YhaH (DUF805 family)
MDQAQIAQHFESRVKRNTKRFLTVLMAVTTTLLAIPVITTRWHTYDGSSKFLAVIFLLALVTKPLFDFRVETREQQQASKIFAISLDGYILTLLAIILFTSH